MIKKQPCTIDVCLGRQMRVVDMRLKMEKKLCEDEMPNMHLSSHNVAGVTQGH